MAEYLKSKSTEFFTVYMGHPVVGIFDFKFGWHRHVIMGHATRSISLYQVLNSHLTQPFNNAHFFHAQD